LSRLLRLDVADVRLAFGLRSAGKERAQKDKRYQKLVQWLTQSLELRDLKAFDITFAVEGFEVDAEG
jgi:hypothetical protein